MQEKSLNCLTDTEVFNLTCVFYLDDLQRSMREIFIEIRTIQEITEEIIVTPRAKHDVVVEQKIKVINLLMDLSKINIVPSYFNFLTHSVKPN